MPRLLSNKGNFINSMNAAQVAGAVMENAATRMGVQETKSVQPDTIAGALEKVAQHNQDLAAHSSAGGNQGNSPSNPGGPSGPVGGTKQGITAGTRGTY